MLAMRNFADRVLDAFDKVANPTCIGLDPRIADIPDYLKKEAMDKYSDDGFEAVGHAILEFNKGIIDATCDKVKLYKPNLGFYIGYGKAGIEAYARTFEYLHWKGAIGISDAKANDIGDTAVGYAEGIMGTLELCDGTHAQSPINADAVTVPPYIGTDCIQPFLDVCKRFGKGIFVLAKTSNPSSGELQDMRLAEVHGGRTIFEHMAWKVNTWGKDLKGKRGYSAVGAVVGAPYPEQAKRCREIMEDALILVPGYGSQGGTARDCMHSFHDDGTGAVINNARNIMFNWQKLIDGKRAYKEEEFGKASSDATEAMAKDLTAALKEAGKLRW